jgi:two-component system, OmpR family, response regulator
VLVVDDDAEQRAALVAFLSSVALTVRQAASATEARAVFESFVPQVVITDISMPDENGYDLVRSLRELPSGSSDRLLVVGITGVADDKTPDQAFAAGFDRLLAKPVDLTVVRAVVEGSS